MDMAMIIIAVLALIPTIVFMVSILNTLFYESGCFVRLIIVPIVFVVAFAISFVCIYAIATEILKLKI